MLHFALFLDAVAFEALTFYNEVSPNGECLQYAQNTPTMSTQVSAIYLRPDLIICALDTSSDSFMAIEWYHTLIH